MLADMDVVRPRLSRCPPSEQATGRGVMDPVDRRGGPLTVKKSREGDGARVRIGVVRASPGDVGSSFCVAKVWVCGAVWKFRWNLGSVVM